VVVGTIVPGGLIILFGFMWMMTGHPLAFAQGSAHFIPNLTHFSNVAFLAGIVLLFAGMEVNAVHVRDLKEPAKHYPKAIFLAVFVIIVVFSLGSLAIAAVIPASKINLTTGLMAAFSDMLAQYHLAFLIPVIGFLVAFGVLAGVLAWIAGPSKGLLATANCGEIPPFLARTNSKGVQVNILIIQGVIVTLLASLYLIIKNVNTAFFLLSAMTVTLYLVMYMLMFAAAIRLRYTQADVPRAYKIPGGKVGIWLVAGTGLLAVVFAFVVGFFPPTQLHVGTPILYIALVVSGLVIFMSAPLLIHYWKKPSWLNEPHVNPE